MDARSAPIRTTTIATAVLALAASAMAQTTAPDSAATFAPTFAPSFAPTSAPASALTPDPASAWDEFGSAGADGPDRARPPLLREGSQLVQITGTVHCDDADGTWIFTIDPSRATPSYMLTLMPSSLLGEMEQMIATAAGGHLVFEVTGQVFVYRERNYLMPTHPPLLIRHELTARAPVSASGEGDDTSGDPRGDTTADIIRNLERRVGPVARRGAADRRAPFGEIGTEGLVASRTLEGSILVERRGIVRRTTAGAYVLVFDADAEGNADPPMRLLPCLLLQQLETYARNRGERARVLVSGHVYTYRGQNYLRPTLFRIPQDRTRLLP